MSARFPSMAMAILLSSTTWGDGLPVVAPPLPNSGFEEAGPEGFPTGWHSYDWGPKGAAGDTSRDATSSRSGQASLRARSLDDGARPGAYTRVALQPGRYALRFFARAEDGRTALVRAYLGDRYSPPYVVGDLWTEVVYERTVQKRRLGAEINIQQFGGQPGTVWFDDLALTGLAEATVRILPDSRPLDDQPQLLYFSGNLNHVRETASNWVRRGFAGFFFSYIMHDWSSNVWAEDGDPSTQGEDDELYREAQEALRECAEANLAHNVLKIALYTDLPDPFDDATYGQLCDNLRQAARFARDVGFPAIAIDTEYVARQYDYSWDGYDLEQHTRQEVAAAIRERWRQAGRALAREYPQADIGVLPEGMLYYGPLWVELLGGLLEGLKAGGGSGDVHIFCEGTYSLSHPQEIREHAEAVRAMALARLKGEALQHWKQRGKIALGAWPLGYYRAVTDDAGKFLGWSGKRDTFGDEIVGSYADKSQRYPLEQFRTQLAAVRTFSDRYCWIYGHGSSWWQLSADQADRYAQKVHRFPRENYLIPTVANIDEYYRVAAQRNVVTWEIAQQ